jgi:hypothetical protein
MTQHHEILRISEEEMRQLVKGEVTVPITKFPMYFCTARNGQIAIWPHFDPDNQRLFFMKDSGQ